MKRKSGKRENNPFSVLLCICTALMLVVIATPVQAETVKMRIFSHVHKMHVIPIGFAKAPANVIFERGGMANLENGEIAVYLARGAVKATPKGR